MAYASSLRSALSRPALYFAPPTKPSALDYDRFGAAKTVVKFGQGAAAALAAAVGANNLTGASAAGPAAPTLADFTSLDAFTLAVLDGRLTGPTQIIAAAFLFLAAGRCTARLMGLFAGLAVVYFYMQGVTLADALRAAGDLGARFAAAANAFQGGASN